MERALPVDDAPAPPEAPLSRLVVAAGRVCSVLFLAAVAISGYEVMMRYAFGRPSSWAHVTVTGLCAIGFCAGGAYAMAHGEHIRISIVVDRMRAPYRRAAEAVGLLVGLLYLCGLSWGLWGIVGESVLRFGPEGNWTPELTPGPPNWPVPATVKLVFLLASLVFALVVLERLVSLLRHRAR